MTATAEETSSQATAVAAATEEAPRTCRRWPGLRRNWRSEVNEISRQMAQSASIAHKAVAEADRTNDTIQGLLKDAVSIGEWSS